MQVCKIRWKLLSMFCPAIFQSTEMLPSCPKHEIQFLSIPRLALFCHWWSAVVVAAVVVDAVHRKPIDRQKNFLIQKQKINACPDTHVSFWKKCFWQLLIDCFRVFGHFLRGHSRSLLKYFCLFNAVTANEKMNDQNKFHWWLDSDRGPRPGLPPRVQYCLI